MPNNFMKNEMKLVEYTLEIVIHVFVPYCFGAKKIPYKTTLIDCLNKNKQMKGREILTKFTFYFLVFC